MTPPHPTQSERRRHILGNTLVVTTAFGLAAVMGLVRNMIIAARFGIGPELDAFYAAFKLPDLLFTVVAGGALATAFIPVFANFLAADDRAGAWRLASAITNLVVLVVALFAGLAALTAPWLVRTLIAPGFDPALQAQTADLMRLVLISTILFGISAVQGSVLHGFKHFLMPALAPVLYPVGIIVGAVWLTPFLGVQGLALGAVLGAALHLAVKIPILLRYGFRWWPVLDLKTPPVRRVLVLMGPRVLDLAVFQLSMLAITNLASRLDAGSVSALEWGWEFMQLPETLIGTAFGLVAFPTLADLAARKDIAGLRATLGETLRIILFLTVPAAVGLILLGRPLLELLYQRGQFDAGSTDAVYTALVFWTVGLMAHAGIEIAARAFFAQEDTVTPLLITGGAGIVGIGLGLTLMGPLGHGGLALGNSLAVSAELVVLLWILRKRWGGVEGWETAKSLGRTGVGAAVMAAVVYGVIAWATRAEVGPLVTLLLGAGVGGGVYLGVGMVLNPAALAILLALLPARKK